MTNFIWDRDKEIQNIQKHGIDFKTARQAFEDPSRIIHNDPQHSEEEARFFCFGKIGENILTVRFTYRGDIIRIIGAGYWRKGEKIYEEEKEKRNF